MARLRMNDDEWECVGGAFAPPARTGRPPRDRRTIVDGVMWVLRTGAAWRDLPEEFGPWATVWDLFNQWNADGTLDEILRRLQAAQVAAGAMDEELWCIDGTIVRAARCAAGGGKKGIPKSPRTMR
jgi:transposase